MKDYTTVNNFLKATEGTDSYYIRDEVFFEEFGIPKGKTGAGKIDDAALNDGRLLILRRRETKLVMLALPGHNDRIYEGIVKAFDRLNYDIRHDPLLQNPLGVFHVLKLENA